LPPLPYALALAPSAEFFLRAKIAARRHHLAALSALATTVSQSPEVTEVGSTI